MHRWAEAMEIGSGRTLTGKLTWILDIRVEVLAGRSDHSIELYVHRCFIESSSSQPVSCLYVKRLHYSDHRQIPRGGVVTTCMP